MEPYVLSFWLLAAICAVQTFSLRHVIFSSSSSSEQAPSPAFYKFRRVYLVAFLLAMGGDWLQGPYVYALYQQYGFTQSDIALLFVTGFLSSAFFGTLFGSVADTLGRRRLSVACCLVYGLSCLTKLSTSFGVLLFGRLLAGIATSLLFSVFESWFVCEHSQQGFSSSLLAQTFGLQTWGNGVVSIVSGIVANFSADAFGLVAPFMLAFVCFALCGLVVSLTWGENYGEVSSKESPLQSLRTGFQLMLKEWRIAALGLTQSLFESAMYCFVFIWTPALQRGHGVEHALPFGWIFASFMVAVMIGSVLFQAAISRRAPEHIARVCYGFASLCLFAPIFSDSAMFSFFCFVMFEVCCGVHFPLISTLRSRHIPEQARASLMNIYRIPMNVIVATVLVNVASIPLAIVFTVCGALLMLCAFLSSTLQPPPEPVRTLNVV